MLIKIVTMYLKYISTAILTIINQEPIILNFHAFDPKNKILYKT